MALVSQPFAKNSLAIWPHLEAYITSFLDRECKVVNPRIELFRAMNEVGIFLLIFDGFDEMAVKVDADTVESNLLEIEKLAASKNGRLMLTSRPEYFISAREESEVLTPTVNPFLTRATHYEPLKSCLGMKTRFSCFCGSECRWLKVRANLGHTTGIELKRLAASRTYRNVQCCWT